MNKKFLGYPNLCIINWLRRTPPPPEKNIKFLASNGEWLNFSYDDISSYQGDTGIVSYRPTTGSGTLNPFQLNEYLSSNAGATTTITNISAIEILDENISAIGLHSFYMCRNLYTVNCPYVLTINSDSFKRCIDLEYVNIPSVISINPTAFDGSTKLTTINCENAVNIKGLAFRDCNNLSIMILSAVNTPTSLASITVFENCPVPISVYVKNDEMVTAFLTAKNWKDLYISDPRKVEFIAVE